MKHTIWVVVNEEGRFWKKNVGRKHYKRTDVNGIYDPKTSTWEIIYPDKFTDILGRAKIFESEKMASSYCKGNGLGTVRAVGLICEEING